MTIVYVERTIYPKQKLCMFYTTKCLLSCQFYRDTLKTMGKRRDEKRVRRKMKKSEIKEDKKLKPIFEDESNEVNEWQPTEEIKWVPQWVPDVEFVNAVDIEKELYCIPGGNEFGIRSGNMFKWDIDDEMMSFVCVSVLWYIVVWCVQSLIQLKDGGYVVVGKLKFVALSEWNCNIFLLMYVTCTYK